MGRATVAYLVLASGLAPLAGGCASYGGLPRSDVRVEVVSSSRVELRRPEVLITANGLRVHGWACRRSRAMVGGLGVLIERLDAEGRVVATVDVPLSTTRLSDHPVGCVAYDGETKWRLNEAETLRVLVRHR